ncbi:APC family permease [Streptomyces sp. WAC05374]|uniref:APC family permease n=1 Tax=Streptomyces sp. WAC05374 TaxID=2487420 RepID=UPI0028B2336E|nr:APC family permease [Streptomyces sp. WAC05374]
MSKVTSTRGTGGHTWLRRELGFRDLVVYGLLFIAPMAPVGIFGTLDARSHGAVALVYLVATVAMAFTAFSYAQMVRVAPRAGSVFAYARKGLGEGPGFLAGWMAMLDYLLIPAVAYLFAGIAMEALVPAVNRWVWTALAVVVTTLLNLWGVRAAARVGFAVLAVEIAVLLVFVVSAVVVLVRDGAQRGWLSPFTGDVGFSLGAVLGAVSVAVLSYLGFDAIASFAEEVVGEPAKVARAVLFCLALTGLLFMAQTYLVALLEPVSSARLAAEPARQGSAFYDAVNASVGAWLHDLVAASKAIGAAFAALAGQAAAGRLLFAMARDRRLPRVLARTDAGVPRVALLLAAAVTMVAAVWAARRGGVSVRRGTGAVRRRSAPTRPSARRAGPVRPPPCPPAPAGRTGGGTAGRGRPCRGSTSSRPAAAPAPRAPARTAAGPEPSRRAAGGRRGWCRRGGTRGGGGPRPAPGGWPSSPARTPARRSPAVLRGGRASARWSAPGCRPPGGSPCFPKGASCR